MASLIDRFVAIESHRCETTEIYLRWSAVSVLSALCGRSVYSKLLGKSGPPLFANTFVILTGAPSQGKTQAISAVKKMLLNLKIPYGADTITPQRFINWYSTVAAKNIEDGRDPSVVVALENMDSLLSGKPDPKLKSFLCASYDCSDRYKQDTIKRGEETARKLCLTFLGGGTPAHVASAFQANEWAEGLAARFLFVASDADIVEAPEPDPEDIESLIRDLVALQDSFKNKPMEMPWTEDALRQRKVLSRNLRRAQPVHPHAVGYWAKKPLSASKLSMIFALSEGASEVTMEHWDESMGWLQEMESGIPEALSLTGGNPYAALQNSVLAWAHSEGRIINEHEIRARMVNYVAPNHLDSIIEGMISSRLLIVTDGDSKPSRKLIHPAHHAAHQARNGVVPMQKVVNK